ncbi:hypothetical protein [Bradyrhizobium sp.]|uniref:hypothetical protein n=1 Tax=Bradyrhizobium sp. TaxID=376 RepID=UPI003C5C9989
MIVAPYGVFALLMLMTSATVSLFAASALCLAVIALDAARGRSLKILGAGSAIVFTALGIYLDFVNPGLSKSAVKFLVDSGIFAISLGSMLARRPFTLQYAREMVPPETAALPGFSRVNTIIAAAWTLAALLMMIANGAMLYVPGLPIWLSLLVAVAARNSAIYFTKWYPQYLRAKSQALPHNAAVPKTP